MFILKIFGGIVFIFIFVFLIFYSLDEKPSRFLKYLLAYLLFFAAIGLSLYIGLLAGIGWMIFIVKGSRGGDDI